jgi:hypothetical protein
MVVQIFVAMCLVIRDSLHQHRKWSNTEEVHSPTFQGGNPVTSHLNWLYLAFVLLKILVFLASLVENGPLVRPL